MMLAKESILTKLINIFIILNLNMILKMNFRLKKENNQVKVLLVQLKNVKVKLIKINML